MYTLSFVKIPDGGLKIPPKLVKLAWNDPNSDLKCGRGDYVHELIIPRKLSTWLILKI